jgi:hypothetical protein
MEKKFDPNEGITYHPYPRAIVEWVDKMIDYKKETHCPDHVDGEASWKLLEYLFEGWKVLYPQEAVEFEQSMDFIRRHTVNHGISKDKGEAIIQHQLEVPAGFFKMFRILFPFQNWDKKFVSQLVKRFKQFAVNV